jgi:hypothetical protein
MKNKLADLNNHLFAQLERLSDEGLSAKKMEAEIRRADAIIGLSREIIDNAALQVKAVGLIVQHGDSLKRHLPMITGEVASVSGAPALVKAAGMGGTGNGGGR